MFLSTPYLPRAYIDKMRAANLQVTMPRAAVLRALIRADVSLSQTEIYREVVQENISITLSSVYNAISKMVHAGILQERLFESGRVYTVVETDRPVRVTCVSCGRSLFLNDSAITAFHREAMARLGFELKDYTLSIRAKCRPDCPGPVNAESRAA